jgi:hypothetical protein
MTERSNRAADLETAVAIAKNALADAAAALSRTHDVRRLVRKAMHDTAPLPARFRTRGEPATPAARAAEALAAPESLRP